ncbi:MAG: Rrf2 family transcriptional regulator [Eggerthellaceae bacterium]|jgi:Rrf2 family nitric oxide-sensitive transcriptional repressor
MKLKASAEYGIRTVVYLAVSNRVCSSREISENVSIPRDYLIQLALRLRKADLIKAHPGKNGGYSLAKPATEITVGQILDAFEQGLKRTQRNEVDAPEDATDETIEVLKICGVIEELFDACLDSIVIQDLVDAYEAGVPGEQLISTLLKRGSERTAQ